MKHVFVIDPGAFAGRQWMMEGMLDAIGQYFRTQEKPDFTTAVSKYPREALGIVQRQADEAGGDAVRVYAVGGDAVLFDCLNGVAGLPNAELAAIPYGTGNVFVRSFGDGNAERFRNVSSMATSPTVPTDAIEVGNICALLGCSVGFRAALTARAREPDGGGGSRGPARLAAALRRSLARFFLLFDKSVVAGKYKVTIDDRDYDGSYSLVDIVNAPFFGRKKTPLPDSAPDDGFLDVVMFKSAGPLATLIGFRRHARGKPSHNCVRLRAKRVEMRSEKPMWIQADGECIMDTGVSFEVLPGAAQIVAPDGLSYRGD